MDFESNAILSPYLSFVIPQPGLERRGPTLSQLYHQVCAGGLLYAQSCSVGRRWKSLWDYTFLMLSTRKLFIHIHSCHELITNQGMWGQVLSKVSGMGRGNPREVEWTGEAFRRGSGQQALNQAHRWTRWRGRGQGTEGAKSLLGWGNSGKSGRAGVGVLPHFDQACHPLWRRTGDVGKLHEDRGWEITWSSVFLETPLEGSVSSILADNKPLLRAHSSWGTGNSVQ